MVTESMKTDKKIEILSPAGSAEHLRAAVFGGADAVYLGTKEYSARQNAENFTHSELEESVRFCHERGVNVYVAVNTLMKNGELSGVVKLAEELCRINVDGVIIQDLSVLEIFRGVCPEMPLHASTQMAIHNLEGAIQLKSLGFSRVVLARELTFEEIEKITSRCGIETEVFIHGAHCMSASGMCYLSSFIGGRSGNRGRCAQPCRLDFKAGKVGNCLSLKDMCYVDHLEKLKKAGVASLKIEGRMKRPEYAYISAKTYKKAVSCQDFTSDMKLLKGVFSRSGFTDGYITGKRNADMFGFRKKEDVDASSIAIKEIEKWNKEEAFGKISTIEYVEIKKDNPLRLTVCAEGKSVSLCSEEIINEQTKLPPMERIASSVKKTGGTPFSVSEVYFETDMPCQIEGETTSVFPISAINALRRECLEKLSSEISKRAQKNKRDYSLPEINTKKRECSEIRIRLEHPSQCENVKDFCGKVIIPYEHGEKLCKVFEKSQIILEIPFLVYPNDEDRLICKMEALRKLGFENVLCENISFVGRLSQMGYKIHGGAYMNVINSIALGEYEKLGVRDMTLSVEINSGELLWFGNNVKIGIVSYGFLPLMQLRNCPLKAHVGCEKCGGNGTVKDRMNNDFPLLCHGKYVSLLNTVPVSVSDKKLCVDFQTLYFTTETSSRVAQVLDAFVNGKEPTYPHTKGLYFRKVL